MSVPKADDGGRPHCVVVGAGHAAASLCAALVQLKWSGRITVVGDEPRGPYHRPPLSKAMLAADAKHDAEPDPLRPAAFYDDHGIALRTGTRVTAIDRAARTLTLAGGDTLGYDTLVLATGSTHRRPPVPGIDTPGVFTLQTADDAARLRARVAAALAAAGDRPEVSPPRAVIVGAGFIGLEAAASLRGRGLDVTVLEMGDRVLGRVTSPVVSDFYAALHRGRGVDLRLQTSAAKVEAAGDDPGDGLRVTTSAGDTLDAAVVVVGAGATPNDQLARDAGLAIAEGEGAARGGVTVDAFNRTSDEHIYAVGDCCRQPAALYEGAPLRLESVQNANDQAKTAAAAIAGDPKPHRALPWFWSDQYDVKLQIAGINTGYDEAVVRGTPAVGEAFSVFYLKAGQLLAVDAVNDARAYALGSRLIPAGGRPDPALLADVSATPKSILDSAKE